MQTNELTNEELERIKRSWVKLAHNHGLVYGRPTYLKAEAFYFAGVINALVTAGREAPAGWTFLLMVGRSPIKDKDEYRALLEQA